MTREQLISLLAMLGSAALFRLITKLIPPKTIVQRDRERLAQELLKTNKEEAKDLLTSQEIVATDLKAAEAVVAEDLRGTQAVEAEDLARRLDEQPEAS